MLNGEVNQIVYKGRKRPQDTKLFHYIVLCHLLEGFSNHLIHQKKIHGLTFTEGLKMNPHTCTNRNTIIFNDYEHKIGILKSVFYKFPIFSKILRLWCWCYQKVSSLFIKKLESGKISNIVSVEVTHENVEHQHIIEDLVKQSRC